MLSTRSFVLRWTKSEIRELLAKELPLLEFEEILAARGTDVIGPTMITTAELRGDQSRYFAKTDDFDRVVGGYFG